MSRNQTADPHGEHDVGCVVVGIGASAGGLQAYKRLLETLPADSGMAFVLIQHLDPDHNSLMVELLTKHTSLPVHQIEDAMPLEANHVYVIPPNYFARLAGDSLYLEAPLGRRGVRLPIDHFFRSLSDARQERAVGIVLSGTGSDGADGLRHVKGAGGLTLVQDPASAEYDGMPRASIATGAVDFVVPVERMVDLIVPYARHPYVQSLRQGTMADSAPDVIQAILALLQAHTDQDYSLYKPGTLTRRIERRMGIRQIDQAAEYLALLRSDLDEVTALNRDLLINVTSFFRNPDAFERLSELLGKSIAEKRSGDPIRVWVPGCSSGEEAYSLAMLLFDLQERQGLRLNLQVFATDVDAQSVATARLGLYSEGAVKDVPEPYVSRYFAREAGRFRVAQQVRQCCVFAVQNLLSDPPFSNLDLISCRNVLIYLEAEAQRRVLDMFHFVMKPEGLLLLGSSESLGGRQQLFEAVSKPLRIFRRAAATSPGINRFPIPGQRGGVPRPVGPARASGTTELSKNALLEDFVPASVVVNRGGVVQYIHGPMNHYLSLPPGEPSLDLDSMLLQGLKTPVRRMMLAARSTDEPVSVRASQVIRQGETLSVTIRVRRLQGGEDLFLISFVDETSAAIPVERNGPPTAESALEPDVARELQTTQEDLQNTIEQLRASNEEIMSMNEELQSTNEELETSREELQSLNEELSTVNNQLHDKIEELEATNDDLVNLLASTDVATLFLDRNLRIRRLTPAAVRLMDLSGDRLGQRLDDIAPRVNDPALVEDAGRVLRDFTPVQSEVRNTDGRVYIRRIMPFRTSDSRIDGAVVTFADVTSLKLAADRVEARERQQAEVAKLGRQALAGNELAELFRNAVHGIVDTLDVDYAKILRLLPGGRELLLEAGVGWQPGLVGTATVPAGIDSQAGYTLNSSGPVISLDLRTEERFRGPQLLVDHEVVSGMSVIIGPEQDPWGVLGTHARHAVAFTLDDTNFILAVANVLWEAVRRQRMEEELRLSEERTAAFLNNSAVVGWMKDDQGRYIYLSDTYIQRFGAGPEWLGRTDRDVWPADIAAVFEANDRRVLDSGVYIETVEEAQTADGVREHWLVSKFPFRGAAGNRCVGGVGVDVTDRVNAQRELEVGEQRLQRLIDSASVGIAFARDDGEIIRANDALLNILALSREQLNFNGLTWQDGLLPEDPEFADALQRLSRADASETMELRRLDAQGRPIWVLAGAQRLDPERDEYVAFLVDVTRQKLVESELAESEERLRLAARLAGFGSYYGDLRQNAFSWSDELRQIFGLMPEDPGPQSAEELPGPIHSDDRQRVRRRLSASLNPAGGGRFRQEFRIVRGDGEQRWLLMQGRTIFSGQGASRMPSRVAGVALDITQRRLFEEQLQNARREADAANEGKSQFLANMSHEIRTPMTAILGFAEVLESRLDDADARACIGTIKENGRYLCQLLDDILDLEKIVSGKRAVHIEPVDVVTVLADVRSLMAVPAREKGLSLTMEFRGEMPAAVQTDARILRQILLNLVGNGVKFTLQGGVRLVTRCLAEEEQLEIAVIDTGVGISADNQKNLFQPFEQVDTSLTRSIGGTGLGLAISRELATLLDGEIALESELGSGSTFTLRVATGSLAGTEWTRPDARRISVDAPESPLDLPSVPARVLVVDDRREIRYLVREFLEHAGASVRTVSNGAEALEAWARWRNSDETFDAVLMDIQMPVMDGLEATRRLREEGFVGPIVALTANVLERDRERCLAAGCDAFVIKPIDRADLLSTLADSLSPPSKAAQPALKVLLVDDNEDSCAALQMLLQQRGYEVRVALNAHGALENAAARVPDVILMDYRLPGVSGDVLLARMRERMNLQECLCIVVSGVNRESSEWQAMGFDAFLSKPVSMDQLDRLLSRAESRLAAQR